MRAQHACGSIPALDREMRGLCQNAAARAEAALLERGDRLLRKSIASFAGSVDAERSNERCLVAAGILAGALAERGLVAFFIQNVVSDLKRGAKRRTIARQSCALTFVSTPENRA